MFNAVDVLVRINTWYSLDILISYLHIKTSSVEFFLDLPIHLGLFILFFYFIMRVILFPCFNCGVNKTFSVLSKNKKGLTRVDLLEAIKEVFLSSAFSESISNYSCQVLKPLCLFSFLTAVIPLVNCKTRSSPLQLSSL